MPMRVALTAALAVLIVGSTATTAPAKPRHRWTHVARPPAPIPMPAQIHEPCPGGVDELTSCYIGPDEADVFGRTFDRGVIFLAVPGRFARLHELGHAFDATMMDPSERSAYARLRGMGDLLWTWSEETDDGVLVQAMGTPAEDFADAYANCRMGHTPWGYWEAGYGYYPTPREHWRVCRLLARAGRDTGVAVAASGDR
jgi:hypothetical protein